MNKQACKNIVDAVNTILVFKLPTLLTTKANSYFFIKITLLDNSANISVGPVHK